MVTMTKAEAMAAIDAAVSYLDGKLFQDLYEAREYFRSLDEAAAETQS